MTGSRRDGAGRAAGSVDVARAVAAILAAAAKGVPGWAIVAGSGLSPLADRLRRPVSLPYAEIPGWPEGQVAGHDGRLVLGELGGQVVAVAAGRVHLYEGYPPRDLVFGLRVLRALGARTLVVTNAAGGLNPDFEPGDVMVLRDHVFLPGLAGASPLVGPNDDSLGPRFPSLVGAYDPALRERAKSCLSRAGLRARSGVYVMVAGPTYETPAEARFLRLIGGDAVGMSTAPEVVAARHAGMRVLGLSLITNRVVMEDEPGAIAPAAGDGAVLHAEVTDVGGAAAPALAEAIERLISEG